jgi:hypothetical protein
MSSLLPIYSYTSIHLLDASAIVNASHCRLVTIITKTLDIPNYIHNLFQLHANCITLFDTVFSLCVMAVLIVFLLLFFLAHRFWWLKFTTVFLIMVQGVFFMILLYLSGPNAFVSRQYLLPLNAFNPLKVVCITAIPLFFLTTTIWI